MIQENLVALHRSFPFERAHKPRRAIGRALLSKALQLIAWFANRRRLRHATDELMSLNDRALADIGLTRADIYFAVRRDPAEWRRGIER
jgi:uncharacterized protein YjiS (DUF1127 family)